jgi:hypothetical protein
MRLNVFDIIHSSLWPTVGRISDWRKHMEISWMLYNSATKTKSMEQNSLETNGLSYSQEIPGLQLNRNVKFSAHNSSLLVSFFSRMNAIPSNTHNFCQMCYNIILPSMPGSGQWLFSQRFPTIICTNFPHLPYTLQTPHIRSLISFSCYYLAKITKCESTRYVTFSSSLLCRSSEQPLLKLPRYLGLCVFVFFR